MINSGLDSELSYKKYLAELVIENKNSLRNNLDQIYQKQYQ
jgi:hypothetical protein